MLVQQTRQSLTVALPLDGLMDSSLSVRCTAPTSPKTLN